MLYIIQSENRPLISVSQERKARFCASCGASLAEAARFCPMCGAVVENFLERNE